MTNELALVLAANGAVAAIVSASIVIVLRPWLQRYALATPNARSSHHEPTPQGGGIAVIAATIIVASVTLFASGDAMETTVAAIFVCAALMAFVGAADDVRPVPVMARLLFQALIIAGVIYFIPPGLQIFPSCPGWIERSMLVLGGLWFVNLVNFMDGLDWMTVAEVVPITAALAVVGWLGALPPSATIVTLALCGAMIGFAYFNRPVATIFLGDVGSLPIGLLLGWLLLSVAMTGHLAAAVLLPLYYLADATITLLRRLIRREPVWQAHRTHFYQRATDGGFTVTQVVARVFFVNVALAALAMWTVIAPSRLSVNVALLGGAVLVALLLFAFARGRR